MASVHPTIVATLAVATAGFGILYAIYRALLPKPLPGIPYNKDSANRILGDIPEIAAVDKAGGRRRLWWMELARKHNAPIVQFFFGLGAKPGIVVADYKEARDIMLRRGKEIIRGSINCDTFLALAPGHFLAMEDYHPDFKSTRAISKDLMSSGFLNSVSGPAAYKMALNLIRLWEFKAKVADGRPFDAGCDISHMTFDIMMAGAVGLPPSTSSTIQQLERLQASKFPCRGPVDVPTKFPKMENPALLDAIYSIEQAIGSVAGYPGAKLYHIVNNRVNPKMREALRVKIATMKYYLTEANQRVTRDKAGFTSTCAADHLVYRVTKAAEASGTSPDLDSVALRDSLLGYIVGGQDSTHTTLCLSVKHLSQHSDVQQNLRSALYATHSSAYLERRQPTVEEITNTQIPYLDAFTQEVLRLTPPSPIVAREASVDMYILGHFIPRGTKIFLPILGPTFQSKGWDIPERLRSETSRKQNKGFSDWADSPYPAEEFWPERWLRPREEDSDDGRLVYDGMMGPFMSLGSGKRGCWGQKLAYLQQRLIITLLVWNFEFGRLPEGSLSSWDMVEELFAKPKNTFVRIRRVWES